MITAGYNSMANALQRIGKTEAIQKASCASVTWKSPSGELRDCEELRAMIGQKNAGVFKELWLA
jgi:hypothetical protein